MEIDRQKKINELIHMLEQLSYVKPEEIPNIDLYMDQVLNFINDRTRYLSRNPKEDKLFTKTMINNYAKTKILPPPVKKKYTKDHILLLSLTSGGFSHKTNMAKPLGVRNRQETDAQEQSGYAPQRTEVMRGP